MGRYPIILAQVSYIQKGAAQILGLKSQIFHRRKNVGLLSITGQKLSKNNTHIVSTTISTSAQVLIRTACSMSADVSSRSVSPI